ncbi:MAG: dihydrofolate reductase family protein [Chitinophagaceae bacterium]
MRKIIVSNFISLDGYFEGQNNELDWFVVGEEFFDFARKQLVDEVDTILFGRITYQMMASYWPDAKDNDPVITDKMNALTKIVFSKTLDKVEWNNSKLIKGNIKEEINKLKQQPGKNIVIFGSGEIVTALTDLGLIDEYRIILNPVVLGNGNSLFKGVDKKLNLKLTNTKTLGTGTVILYYQPEK